MLRMFRGKIALGLPLAFSGGFLYGASSADTNVKADAPIAFSHNLTDDVERAVASLPSPAIAPIIFNTTVDEVLVNEGLGDSIETTPHQSFSAADYYCLPAPQSTSSANSIGQTLSVWDTQISQDRQESGFTVDGTSERLSGICSVAAAPRAGSVS
ncbi:MAG: hypothetical protein AAGF93_07195 [Cyanobacteria bacterium P01_H01_bin.105]